MDRSSLELSSEVRRLPPWLKRPLSHGPGVNRLRTLVGGLSLHTVCESARCPNLSECFSKGTATFMILGDVCTRRCGFCAIDQGRPLPVDEKEPEHVAQAALEMGLRHVVITAVARDDLKDGGAGQFAKVIEAIRKKDKAILIETLISDLRGNEVHLETILAAGPDILNHNLETVVRLHPWVRPQARYERSIGLLRRAKEKRETIWTKSGLMLGLGETPDEVIEVLRDLREAGCQLLTVGQYLQPASDRLKVVEFIHPDQFKWYEEKAYEMGFSSVASGSFVRSSYHAEENFRKFN
ncbi:MAG: lipoyl synthase [Candidatus Omnitrophica bacterium]|nr:lipoyl synthase [Candidatus Omnitrophota bacterium]